MVEREAAAPAEEPPPPEPLAPRAADAPMLTAFERHHRPDRSTAVAGGLLLLGELGCATCHDPGTAAPWITTRSAPRLQDVAQRWSPTALRQRIASPHAFLPGTTMPDVWAAVPPEQRDSQQKDAEVEALLHFLRSKSRSGFVRTPTDEGAAQRGEALFHEIGCVACHAPTRTEEAPAYSVPLPAFAGEAAYEPLWRFLRDPHSRRPSGRMPSLSLRDREAQDLAHFLLRGTRVPAPLDYILYRGPLESLDDFEEKVAWRTGIAQALDPELAGQDRDFRLRFEGFLQIPRDGEYSFHLNSDDGSRLWIDGEELIDNDGHRRNQKAVSRSGTRTLTAGWRPFALEYFQRVRNRVLELEWEGPELPRQPVPSAAFRNDLDPPPPPEELVLDESLAARGRELFSARHCAACHQDLDREATEEATRGAPFAALGNLEAGCLADQEAGPVDHRLDAGQREALRAALAFLRTPESLEGPTAGQRVAHTMHSFRCDACHVRGDEGGPDDLRDEFFVSRGHDLGEEGRLPPHLDGVGDRLQPEWLTAVLEHGRDVRPYLATRMPRYRRPEVSALAADFVDLDLRQEAPPRFDGGDPETLAEQGRQLIGEDGMGCITCHHFHRRPAPTMDVVDLVGTTERLNRDWFERYLRKPSRYRPGTRMPGFWPGGVSSVAEVHGGDASAQIEALWTYLSAGEKVKPPEGLSRKITELIVGGETVVYRGKLWEAGFRGIAVGTPAGLHYSFDAQNLRLAVLWKERFLNVAAHWGVQGMGRVRPLARDPRVLPPGPAFARLASPEDSWPDPGRAEDESFLGHDVDEENRPTFRYRSCGVEIQDTLRPREADGALHLHRVLRWSGETSPEAWMRLAAGERIEATDDGRFDVDGKWKLRVLGDAEPLLRGAEGDRELLLPAFREGGEGRIELEYSW